MHIPAVGMVGYILTHWAQVALWYWVASSYAAMGILKIRTFLEHQAHDKPRGRTVVIEDRGPLALLFLNNNYHAVHHAHPKVAWYKLPQMFETGRDTYLSRNFGYYYKNYAQIFTRHLLRAKDPVPHPLRPVTHHQMDKTG
jgi:fatty acid desaturase